MTGMWTVIWKPQLVVQARGLGHQDPRTREGPTWAEGPELGRCWRGGRGGTAWGLHLLRAPRATADLTYKPLPVAFVFVHKKAALARGVGIQEILR